MTSSTVELTASSSHADDDVRVKVEIDLAAGGRLRQITVSDPVESVVLLAPTAHPDPASTGWGSFPMAPWAGRIGNGRFRFLGDDVRLDLNHEDGDGSGGGPIVPPRPNPDGPVPDDLRRGHAIHGTTFGRRWEVVDAASDRIEITCPVEGALGWPYPGTARQVITVRARSLHLELAVEPAVGSAFPATVGWHPWFVKPERLEFHPVAMYARDEIGLPTGELVHPPEPPWDDCFVNHEPVELHYRRRLAPVVRVSSRDCDHWVVFDMPSHATCVEPQSGPPDGPTLRPEVATPSHPVRRTMTIVW